MFMIIVAYINCFMHNTFCTTEPTWYVHWSYIIGSPQGLIDWLAMETFCVSAGIAAAMLAFCIWKARKEVMTLTNKS